MRRQTKTSRITLPGASYGFQVVGGEPTPLRDFYHALLLQPWWTTFGLLAGTVLVVNAIFAAVFMVVGGVTHAAPGSFLDAFFFSVQTMGTIGYGTFSPESTAANAVVVVESITSLTLTALATGLVFAKVSRSTARMIFTKEAVICPMNGVPTLMFRMGNQRGNQIVGAQVRVVVTRTEKTAEGETFYRTLDLKLQRDHLLSLQRSWSAMHTIDEESPLFGETPDSLIEKEIEMQVLVVGLDDTSMQMVHAGHRYFTHEIVFGRRHVDILSEAPNGDIVLDLRRFQDTEPTRPTPGFPYPRE